MAVTCPFTINNLSRSAPCEHYAESKKHAFYDEDFKGTQFTFAALVLESTGGISVSQAILNRVGGGVWVDEDCL